jgi:phage terminase large subunit
VGIGASVGSMLNSMGHRKHFKYNAGGVVFNPDREYKGGKLNKEHFTNIKAQSWWLLADRFRNTYLAITEGKKFQSCEMISISSNIDAKVREKLIKELSTPLKTYDQKYRVKVEGKKELKKRNVKSPNIADALVIASSGNGLSKYTFDDII